MNVGTEFEKIRIHLAQNGFIPVLEQVPHSLVLYREISDLKLRSIVNWNNLYFFWDFFLDK